MKREPDGSKAFQPPVVTLALLGVVGHLHFCGSCDGGIGVTSGGVICIQLPVGGVQRLGGWVGGGGNRGVTWAVITTPHPTPPAPGCWGPWPRPHLVFAVQLGFVPRLSLRGQVGVDGANGRGLQGGRPRR